MPVSADVSLEPPDAHPKLGKPSARWTYRNSDGETLFHVMRFDPLGECKQFFPLSLWREPAGAMRWHWKGVPQPRPLYGLDTLATMPGAPAVVCEGEKACDAAARIFPGRARVTSPGGAQAAAKADWNPLAGRRVLIWPDADDPATKYANAVACILHGLGCKVSVPRWQA
ncbi:MAG: hypothetical protein ACT4O2_12950 [Beijerinckiaceae bacterium]